MKNYSMNGSWRFAALIAILISSPFVPSWAQTIQNGGFEFGSSNWTLSGAAVNSAPGSSDFAHTGSKYLILGGANNANDSAYQEICIPGTATAAALTYYYNITSFETTTTTAFDKFTNTIRSTTGAVLALVGTWSNLDKDPAAGNPYHLKTFNLLPYKGSTVRIHFTGTNDYADYTTFRLDDVSVQITVPATTVQTLAPSFVTTTSAQMNGSVNPNGLSTSAYFEYGTTASYGSKATPLLFGACITTAQGIQATLTGLTPGVTYHYRAVASNSSGVIGGSDAIISTTSLPSPDLVSVTGIPAATTVGQPFIVTITGRNTAGLGGRYSAINASVLYNDGDSEISVDSADAPWADDIYVLPPGHNINSSSCASIPAANWLIEAADDTWTSGEQHSFSFTITPNKVGTLYVRARVTLHNGDTGCDYFNDTSIADGTLSTDQQGWPVRQYAVTVSPAQPAPSVQTLAASSVTTTSAWFNGFINPNGSSTTAYFEYGTTTGYGSTTASGNFGVSVQDIGFPITGLSPSTTYHFRILASNSGGINRGEDSSFITKSPVNPNLPSITTQPQSQTVPVEANVTFTVTAGGAIPRNFQWRRNEMDVAGATSASFALNNVQPGNAGDYLVVVNNSYGATTSAVAKLTVFLPPPTPQPSPPTAIPATQAPSPTLIARPPTASRAQLVVFNVGGSIDRNKMTIVLTHGWLSSSDNWPRSMKSLLLAFDANVVAWDWRQNASKFLSVAASRTCSEGEGLGSELLDALGAGYNKPIHFLGHSLGTFVNCHAADFIHGDAKNSPGKLPGSTLKFNPQNTHMTLFDEAELETAVSGIHVFLDVLFRSTDDTTAEIINCFWAKVIPEQSAWIDNYISEVGLLHAKAANILLWKRLAVPGINDFIGDGLHGYSYSWYSASVSNPFDSEVGHRLSFERNTIPPLPPRGTYYLQSLDLGASLLAVTPIDSATASLLSRDRIVAYPTLQAYRGLNALGSAVESVYLDGIQYAGAFLLNVAQSFAPPGGQPVFVGNANSTPAYFIPPSAPSTHARWDFQFTVQTTPIPLVSATHLLSLAGVPDNTNVYVLVPISVPRVAVGMSFEFRLDGAGATEYFTMGIADKNYFLMEAKFVDDGVWMGTSVIDISEYAGQSVELFFSLNDDVPPNGILSVRAIQFYSPPPPNLNLAISNNQAVLSWPLSSVGWQLESSDTLTASSQWTPSASVPSVLGYHFIVTNSPVNGTRFFRLRK